MEKVKILFLLKQNSSYGSYFNSKSGLLNSAKQVSISLKENFNVDTKIETCIDGNSIDKELHLYKPDICIIEALWVTPEKIRELSNLHNKVKFIIRIHSKVTFLSNEGIAFDWIERYIDNNKFNWDNVYVSFNNEITSKEMKDTGFPNKFLPNIYKLNSNKPSLLDCIISFLAKENNNETHTLNIGCFGAIRPMKNQLLQAIAAIILGNKYGYKIRFHINSGRIEQKGESVLKNLRALFDNCIHELVEHDWMEHDKFVELVKTMDVGMQVSLSESFNIVTADFVDNNIPILVSKDIDWMPCISKVDNNNALLMVNKLKGIIKNKSFYATINKRALFNYNTKAINQWRITFFNNSIKKLK